MATWKRYFTKFDLIRIENAVGFWVKNLGKEMTEKDLIIHQFRCVPFVFDFY